MTTIAPERARSSVHAAALRAADMALASLVKNPLIIGLAILMLAIGLQSENFFGWDNWRGILLQASTVAVAAVAQGLLIIAGYIDLSIGSVLGVCGVLAGFLMTKADVNPVAACVVALAAGASIGAINGFLVAYLRFSAIVVTLGMLTLVHGVTFMISVQTVAVFGSGFGQLGKGSVASIPIPVIIAACVLLAGWLFLSRMPGGRHTYAIGVNAEAAYLSGISVRRIPCTLFIASGLSAGLAGLIMASRLDSAPSSSLGVGFELTVLTAVLLGGVAFAGGRGSVLGIFLGVMFLAVLQNGLALLNVPFAWQLFASGFSLVVAAGLESLSARLGKRRSRLRLFDIPRPGSAGETTRPERDRPVRS